MIAPADFCRPAADVNRLAFVEDDYCDDSLVPGADPYIAQLVAEHQAELLAPAPLRTMSFVRPSTAFRRSDFEVAVA